MKIISLKFSKMLSLMLFAVILIILLTLGSTNFQSVQDTVNLFLTNVFPSLFPFVLFTEITLKTGIIHDIAKWLSFIPKIFKLSSNSILPILIGFLCGFPSGARAVDSLYEQGKISKRDADILISFVNNNSPIFILTTIGISMMYNASIGLLLLLAQDLASLIIGFVYARFYPNTIIQEKQQNENSLAKKSEYFAKNKQNIVENSNKFEVLQKSILNALITMGFILGFMVIFNMLADLTLTFLQTTSVANNPYVMYFITGLFEVTKGCRNISLLPDYFTKIVIASFLLGFSGFSIIFQIKSQLKSLKTPIKKLIIFKVIHGILSAIIAYILLKYTSILNLDTLQVFANITEDSYYMHKVTMAYLHSIAFIIIILATYFVMTVFNKKSSQ